MISSVNDERGAEQEEAVAQSFVAKWLCANVHESTMVKSDDKHHVRFMSRSAQQHQPNIRRACGKCVYLV